jgi:hypothetical protein
MNRLVSSFHISKYSSNMSVKVKILNTQIPWNITWDWRKAKVVMRHEQIVKGETRSNPVNFELGWLCVLNLCLITTNLHIEWLVLKCLIVALLFYHMSRPIMKSVRTCLISDLSNDTISELLSMYDQDDSYECSYKGNGGIVGYSCRYQGEPLESMKMNRSFGIRWMCKQVSDRAHFARFIMLMSLIVSLIWWDHWSSYLLSIMTIYWDVVCQWNTVNRFITQCQEITSPTNFVFCCDVDCRTVSIPLYDYVISLLIPTFDIHNIVKESWLRTIIIDQLEDWGHLSDIIEIDYKTSYRQVNGCDRVPTMNKVISFNGHVITHEDIPAQEIYFNLVELTKDGVILEYKQERKCNYTIMSEKRFLDRSGTLLYSQKRQGNTIEQTTYNDDGHKFRTTIESPNLFCIMLHDDLGNPHIMSIDCIDGDVRYQISNPLDVSISIIKSLHIENSDIDELTTYYPDGQYRVQTSYGCAEFDITSRDGECCKSVFYDAYGKTHLEWIKFVDGFDEVKLQYEGDFLRFEEKSSCVKSIITKYDNNGTVVNKSVCVPSKLRSKYKYPMIQKCGNDQQVIMLCDHQLAQCISVYLKSHRLDYVVSEPLDSDQNGSIQMTNDTSERNTCNKNSSIDGKDTQDKPITNDNSVIKESLIIDNKTVISESCYGYKIAYIDHHLYTYCIIKLRLSKGALISDPSLGKIRTNEAKVVKIVDCRSGLDIQEAFSMQDTHFIYQVGEVVHVDDFDTNIHVQCSQGIHFFFTAEMALTYRDNNKTNYDLDDGKLTKRIMSEEIIMSTEVVPSSTEVVSSSTEVVFSSTEVVPSSTEVVPSSTEVVPSSTEVVPSSTEVVPSSTEVVPSSTEVDDIDDWGIDFTNSKEPKHIGKHGN